MNQPLGNAVGNALEVREAIEILQGRHEGDLKEVSFTLAAKMLVLSKAAENEKRAREKLQKTIDSGEALRRFARMIELQGGDPSVCEDPARLPAAKKLLPVAAETTGYLAALDTVSLGVSAMLLGAGRMKKEDRIDPAVGYWMKKRLGDPVEEGETVAEFHINDEANLEDALGRFQQALKISQERPELPPLIHDTF